MKPSMLQSATTVARIARTSPNAMGVTHAKHRKNKRKKNEEKTKQNVIIYVGSNALWAAEHILFVTFSLFC